MRGQRQGVLCLAFGGPESLDEVPAFLRALTGQDPSPTVVQAVVERYRAVGGHSPLPAATRAQAEALAAELAQRGRPVTMAVGMRYARPSIAEAVRELAAAGVDEAALLALAPFRARVSTEGYRAEAVRAWEELGRPFALRPTAPWHDHPGFVAALRERLEEALARFPPKTRPAVPVVWTAHSLPVSQARSDPYVADLEATVALLRAGVGPRPWRVAYQSRGMGGGEWLGPDVEEVLLELAAAGFRAVVLQPIGFVADHMETVYDNDVLHRRRAEELGLRFVRCSCLNTSATFIRALADVVEEALAEAGAAREARGQG